MRRHDLIDLLIKLLKIKFLGNGFPLAIRWDITARCPMQCRYCDIWKLKIEELNTDAILKIINEEEGLPFWEEFDFEFDLMVLNAHKQFDFFTRLGAKKIVFHLEAETETSFKEFLESLDPYYKDNVEIGIAINTTTDISKLEPFINLVDYVQCMGIEHDGFQGEPFDERSLGQIKDLRSKYPELKISVDGAVDENTAPLLLLAGANRLVIGSAILNSFDIRETIREFEKL